MPLRFWVAKRGGLLGQVYRIFSEEVRRWVESHCEKSPEQKAKIASGTISFIQRYGSINLNPHFHMLVLDGAYAVTEEGKTPQFHWIENLSAEEVADLVKTLAIRIVRYLKRQGHFQDDSEYLAEDSSPEGEILPALQAASVQSKIALGERRGQQVRRLGRLELLIGGKAETTAPLCAEIRSLIVPEKPKDASNEPTPKPAPQKKPRPRIKWVELLARVFAIDMKSCPNCGGEFKPIAAGILGKGSRGRPSWPRPLCRIHATRTPRSLPEISRLHLRRRSPRGMNSLPSRRTDAPLRNFCWPEQASKENASSG